MKSILKYLIIDIHIKNINMYKKALLHILLRHTSKEFEEGLDLRRWYSPRQIDRFSRINLFS